MDFGLSFVLFVASMLLSTVLNKKAADAAEDEAREQGMGHLITTKSSKATKPLIYGELRVGGNMVHAISTGDDKEFMHIIMDLGEGPIHGITREDGSCYTTTSTKFPRTNAPRVYLDDKLWTEYGTEAQDLVHIELFRGTADQSTCASLAAADSNWVDPKRHTAYLYIKLKYNFDVFLSRPDITAVVQGLEVLDPDAGTVAYSDNFALAAYDMLTRPSTRGGMGLDVWSGPVPATPRIQVASVEAARAYCETKGWTGGIIINKNNFFIDNLQMVLDCFRGDIVYSEGVFKFKFKDLAHETVAMELEESDIIEQNGSTTLAISPRNGAFTLPNAIRATYYNADKKYHEDDLVFPDAAAVASDGDYREVQFSLMGLNTLEKLKPMCGYLLERERWGHIGSMMTGDKVVELESNDLIQLTHSMPGWVGRTLRVQSLGYSPDQHITIEYVEEDASLYNKTYDTSALTYHTTTLPQPTDAVPSVVNLTLTEENYSTRQRTFTRLVLDFDAPSNYPWWHHAEIWLRIGSTGNWRYMTTSDTGYIMEGVEEGETYALRAISVNDWGIRQASEDAAVVSRAIEGYTSTNPSNITSASVSASGSVLTIVADPITDPNVIGYEVRLGDTWTTSTFLAMLLDRPEARIAGVKPGSHTVWVAAKNNAGLYSASPTSASITIPYPTSYTYYTTNTYDYDEATSIHSNTEQSSHDFGSGSVDALRGSHTGSLSGTWTSPTEDNGSIKRTLLYCEFLSDFSEGNKYWNSLIGSTEAISDVVPTGITWNQIWTEYYAPYFNVTLQYGDAAVDENEFEDFATSSIEIDCRYFRVVISLTDPENSANMYISPFDLTYATYE